MDNYALVIDDNSQMADNLCDMLALFEIEARAVYSSRVGIIALRRTIPTVIFLDINMPGVGGFEVLGYLSREPRLADVPVFVVSSDDQPETIARALDSGVQGYLVKPVTVEKLEASLQSVGLLNR